MVTYVVLAKFTDQGIRNAKDSPKRADAFKEMAKTFGVTVKDIVWTQGRYDVVTDQLEPVLGRTPKAVRWALERYPRIRQALEAA